MKVTASQKKIYDRIVAQFQMCMTNDSMTFETWLQDKNIFFHYPESGSVFDGNEAQAKRRLLSMFRNNFDLEVEPSQPSFGVEVRVRGHKALDFYDGERRVAIGQDGSMATFDTRVNNGVKETLVQEHPPKKLVGLIFEHTNAGFQSV